LWPYKTAILFTLPESGAQSKESKVFVIVGTFLFVILLYPFFFFFSLPFKFARAVFNRIVNNMFVFLLCASVFLIYIVFNRIVNNMFVLPGLFFFFFLNFTLNSRKSWREKVYINCCFEYEV
jgi:membrane-associated HD superfamily phosphohydrolase